MYVEIRRHSSTEALRWLTSAAARQEVLHGHARLRGRLHEYVTHQSQSAVNAKSTSSRWPRLRSAGDKSCDHQSTGAVTDTRAQWVVSPPPSRRPQLRPSSESSFSSRIRCVRAQWQPDQLRAVEVEARQDFIQSKRPRTEH